MFGHGINVVVSGTVLGVTEMTSKSGNQFYKVRIGWLQTPDEEGKGGTAGQFTATVGDEVGRTLELGQPIQLHSNGREKDFKIDCGFFNLLGQAAAAAKARRAA